MDLRTFFRFLKSRQQASVPFDQISIKEIDLPYIRSIKTVDVFEFMNFVADERNNMSSTRQRKSTSLKSFFSVPYSSRKAFGGESNGKPDSPQKGKDSPPIFVTRTKYRTFECSRWARRRAGPLHSYPFPKLRHAPFRTGFHQPSRCDSKQFHPAHLGKAIRKDRLSEPGVLGRDRPVFGSASQRWR